MSRMTYNVPLPILGLDSSKPAEFIDARAASSISNVTVTRGELRKRWGTTAVGTTLGERVVAIFELQVGSSTYLVRVGLTKVELLNKGTGAWSSIANAVLTGAVTDRVDYAFPHLSGSRIVVFSNGIDNIRKYTGTGNDADLGGSPPKAKYLQEYASYLVLGGIASYPQRVQWSDTGNPESYSGGNSGSQELNDDPEDITGLANWGPYLTVHKNSCIYVGQAVSTSDVLRFDRKATGAGAVCFATIQELPTGEQIFLAKDGLHLFNGVTAPWVEAAINEEIRDSLNPNYVYKCWSVLRRDLDEYHVAVPMGSDTEPNTIYKYNWRLGQIYKDTRTNISAANSYLNTLEVTWNDLVGTWEQQSWRWDDATLQTLCPLTLYGGTTGITTKDDTTVNNDNTVAIDANWDSKDFTAQDLGISDYGTFIRVVRAELWAKGSSVDAYYSTNSGTSWTKINSYTLDSDYPSDDAPLNIWLDVMSTKVRFRFKNATAAESFTIKKFSVDAVIRERRV